MYKIKYRGCGSPCCEQWITVFDSFKSQQDAWDYYMSIYGSDTHNEIVIFKETN